MYIRRTRRTDTALGTFYRDGGVSLAGDTAPCRRITEFVHELYLGHGCTVQIHTAGYRHVRFSLIQHLHRCVRYVQHVTTCAIHCTEVEGKGFRVERIYRIREGMVVGIVFNNTYERVEVRYVVGLTYQRYLQARHRLRTGSLSNRP